MPELKILEINTRQKIIEAALSIAAKEGLSRATTYEIARQAGVSEGIIYHYFKSKHELCCDMIKEHADEFRHQLSSKIKGCRSATDKINKLIAFNFQYFTGKGNIFQAVYGKSGDTTIMMGHILKVAIMPYTEIVEDIIKQGIKEGVFKQLNPSITASALIGMMQLTIIRLHFGFAMFSIKDARNEIRRIFLGGLLR